MPKKYVVALYEAAHVANRISPLHKPENFILPLFDHHTFLMFD